MTEPIAELDGEPAGGAELAALALTNYGHFTSMRVEDGRVRGLGLHLERLRRDCRTLFGADLDPRRIRELARRLAPAGRSVVLRVTVFDPELSLARVSGPARPSLLVTSRPAVPLPLPPLRARSVVYRRDLAAVKSVGLFGTLYQRREAQRAGFDDVLFTDERSAVSEGGTWNVGFVRDGRVVWPLADCLVGTTMELLQQVHRFSVEQVRLADVLAGGFEAAFTTNAAVGVRALGALDGHPLAADHPLFDVLRARYADLPGEPL